MQIDLEEFKDFKLEEDEILAFYEAFQLFDQDNSDSISLAELKSVLKALGKDMSDDNVREMMNSIDKDGSGEICFKEFLELMQTHMDQQEPDKKLQYEEAFLIFDRDENSMVSSQEIIACIKHIGSEKEQQVIDVLKRFEGEDGQINYKELVTKLLAEGDE